MTLMHSCTFNVVKSEWMDTVKSQLIIIIIIIMFITSQSECYDNNKLPRRTAVHMYMQPVLARRTSTSSYNKV